MKAGKDWGAMSISRIKTIVSLCILFGIAFSAPADSADAGNERFQSSMVFKSVRHELGGLRGSYFVDNALVAEQIGMGLGIPDPIKNLADGNYLVSGCRPHSCDEKAAVIATPTGGMLLAGLVYFHCYQEKTTKGNPASARALICDSDPRLMVFAKRENIHPALMQELQDWAESVGSSIRQTETRVLPLSSPLSGTAHLRHRAHPPPEK